MVLFSPPPPQPNLSPFLLPPWPWRALATFAACPGGRTLAPLLLHQKPVGVAFQHSSGSTQGGHLCRPTINSRASLAPRPASGLTKVKLNLVSAGKLDNVPALCTQPPEGPRSAAARMRLDRILALRELGFIRDG